MFRHHLPPLLLRVEGMAHGGQTLMSCMTMRMLGGDPATSQDREVSPAPMSLAHSIPIPDPDHTGVCLSPSPPPGQGAWCTSHVCTSGDSLAEHSAVGSIEHNSNLHDSACLADGHGRLSWFPNCLCAWVLGVMQLVPSAPHFPVP